MIKEPIYQEDITILSINASNIRAPKYIKQKLTEPKGEINSNIIMIGDFNIPFLTMDRVSRQRISKKTADLSNTL